MCRHDRQTLGNSLKIRQRRMFTLRSVRNLDWPTVLVIGAIAGAAILIGLAVSTMQFGIRELVIFVLIVLGVTMILMPAERVIRYGFVLWILTFGLGWRTIYLTPNLNFHPSELLAWLLFGLIAVRKAMSRDKSPYAIPVYIPLLMLFSVSGILVSVLRNTPWDSWLEEAKILFALIPTFYVVKWVVADRKQWDQAARLAVWIATYVSLLGLMDYFAPNLSRALAPNASIDPLFVSEYQHGFGRVGFIFYGSFAAGFLIFTFFGLTIHYLLSSWGKSRINLILYGSMAVIQIAAMYLSGYRGIYYALIVLTLAYALVYRRAWFLVLAAVAALPLLPSQFFERFISLVDTRFADSSQFDRIQRAQSALDLISESPLFGVGWAGSGYVHSDLVQLGADLGLPALGVFVVWLLSMTRQLFSLARGKTWVSTYGASSFAMLCGLFIVLAGEGIIVWIQLMIPVWFLFAMGYKLFEFEKEVKSIEPAQIGLAVAEL